MENEFVRLEMEKAISSELRERFRGDVIERLLREGKVESAANPLKSILEGHSFKITRRMAPRLYDLCADVQKSLGLTDAVEYYVTSSAVVNAAVFPRLEEDQTHLLMIHSASLERFSDDEMRFVLGHEFGHLLSHNSELLRIIGFVFPDPEQIPTIFRNKLEMWSQLAELSADRYGFIAAPTLETSVRAFFKMASGLDVERIEFDPLAYLKEMDEAIEYFHREPAAVRTTHPVTAVRLKALQFFSESALYRDLAAGRKVSADEALRKRIEPLLEVLAHVGVSELDEQRKRFVAAGGLLIAGVDQEMSADELDGILGPLSVVTSFPKEYLEKVAKSDDIGQVFAQAAQTILVANPAERYPMFEYLVDIALADREIRDREIEVLFQIGEGLFKFTSKEVAQQLGAAIQRGFVPRFVG